MSNEQRFELAEHALRQMRSTVVPVEDPARVEERRPSLVAELGAQIRLVPVRRVRRERWLWGLKCGASAAAALALAWGGLRLASDGGVAGVETSQAIAASEGAHLRSWTGDVTVGRRGHEHALSRDEESALEAESFLSTRQSGWVELELPGSARVEVGAETELQVLAAEPQNRRLQLLRGRVDLEVDKPTDGTVRRLVVSTPNAEVEVRGTVFSVEVRPSQEGGAQMVTNVSVSRGSVVVRHAGREHHVPGGSRWTSGSAGFSSEVEQETLGAQGAGQKAIDHGKAHGSLQKAPLPESEKTVAPSKIGPKSTLAQENRLFEQALEARDVGDWHKALRLCDQFLARYPESALKDSVRVERTRAAKQLAEKLSH